MTLAPFAAIAADGVALDTLPDTPGVHDLEATLPGGGTGRFTLALPQAGDGPRPLVVVLHYGGQPTRWYGRPLLEDLFEPAWRELGAVYLAPESLGGQWHTEQNEAFVMNLVELVGNTLDIDPARRILAGYSMGAIGSWHFVSRYPATFAAAVPVAGFSAEADTCPVPIYALATQNDEIFDYDRFAAHVDALARSGSSVEFVTVPARGHYDVAGFRDALKAVPAWLEAAWKRDHEENPR
ncbi:MAG: carboxylesterase family protein [Gammaproteobacteria bacterium]